MAQIWSAHRALIEWRKDKVPGMYISSILMKNENVPRFEERFGHLDYDWLLAVTKDRKCVATEPVVIKYIAEDNLSFDPYYRKSDFYMNLMIANGNLGAAKRIFSTYGRYHYKMGNTKTARFWFRRSDLNLKNAAYYITSYFPFIRKYVSKKFRVIA